MHVQKGVFFSGLSDGMVVGRSIIFGLSDFPIKFSESELGGIVKHDFLNTLCLKQPIAKKNTWSHTGMEWYKTYNTFWVAASHLFIPLLRVK